MNGYHRLQYAAECNSTWKVGGKDFAGKMMNIQDFVSDEYDLFIQVTYSGYTVKAAKLWDFLSDDVDFQQLTADDCDKASRIENVLLGNGRRF